MGEHCLQSSEMLLSSLGRVPIVQRCYIGPLTFKLEINSVWHVLSSLLFLDVANHTEHKPNYVNLTVHNSKQFMKAFEMIKKRRKQEKTAFWTLKRQNISQIHRIGSLGRLIHVLGQTRLVKPSNRIHVQQRRSHRFILSLFVPVYDEEPHNYPLVRVFSRFHQNLRSQTR